LSKSDNHRQALGARNYTGYGSTTRPTSAQHGAILRGVIAGPITPTMRAAQVYNVHLEGAVRAVIQEVPLAPPAGMSSYNGATYLAHLSEGDQVLVGFNNATSKPVILCSLYTNEYPSKTDNETNKPTKKQSYTQPPGSAFKDFLPTWLYLGKVFGQIAPYEALSIEENQTNPDTTAGTRMPGVFNIYTFNGDRLEYTPGTTYRMSVGSVVDHIPGVAHKTPEDAQKRQEVVQKETERLVRDVTSSGNGASGNPEPTGSRLGVFNQEENPTSSRAKEAAQIGQEQTRYAMFIQRAAQEWQQAWSQRVLEVSEQLRGQWEFTGEPGIKPGDKQPFTLGQALSGRVVPLADEETGGELPTIFTSVLPPIFHSDEPKSQGGRKAFDLNGMIAMVAPYVKMAQSFMKALQNPSVPAFVQQAQQVMAVVLDYYKVPMAPELVKVVDKLATTPPNLVGALDFFNTLGDQRLSLAASAMKLVVAPSTAEEVFQTLEKVWEQADVEGQLPDYVREMLTEVTRLGADALPPLLSVLNLPMPDMEEVAKHPWRIADWFVELDQRLPAIGQAWERGDIAEALLRVSQYTGGITWDETPSEREAVYELFKMLTRRYVWQ
jgi:hypothetical protein